MKKIQNRSRIVLCLLTLPIGGVLGVVLLLMRGPVGLPAADPAAWAGAVTTDFYTLAQSGYILAYVLPYLGFWGIYACLSVIERVERAAFYGFIGAILGTSLALPTLGVYAYASPLVGDLYLQGQTHLLQVITGTTAGLPLSINLLGGTLYLLGTTLLGVAIWRSETLPKGSGLLMALHGLFLVIGFTMFPVLLLGWVFLAVSGGWIILAIWRQA